MDDFDGARPSNGLTAGRDGNLYGATFYGSANGYGSIFRMTPPAVSPPCTRSSMPMGLPCMHRSFRRRAVCFSARPSKEDREVVEWCFASR